MLVDDDDDQTGEELHTRLQEQGRPAPQPYSNSLALTRRGTGVGWVKSLREPNSYHGQPIRKKSQVFQIFSRNIGYQDDPTKVVIHFEAAWQRYPDGFNLVLVVLPAQNPSRLVDTRIIRFNG